LLLLLFTFATDSDSEKQLRSTLKSEVQRYYIII